MGLARSSAVFGKRRASVSRRAVRYLLPPPPPTRGITFVAERRLAYGPPRTAKGEQTQKDVKMNGTNSVKFSIVNKSLKKRTQNELVLA
jgi:hypothetical protein